MGMPLKVPLPTYTVDEVRAFPRDGFRYELLEGILLVTPSPSSQHQIVVAELLIRIGTYLEAAGLARVVGPGAIEVSPATLLEPDVLVFPTSYPRGTAWADIREWWLAVEVFSPGSRRYDRDYKRDAYLALGVREVWLVDLDEKCVLVSREGAPRDVRHMERLLWHPAELAEPLTMDLSRLFRGLP